MNHPQLLKAQDKTTRMNLKLAPEEQRKATGVNRK
jgi:hypothetical protein